jgi:hypothetical protein
MQLTEDKPIDDFEYAFEIIIRKLKINKEIEDIDAGMEPLSPANGWKGRLNAEVQAINEWEIDKGTATTGDKAILKYFPLPDKPVPPPEAKSKTRNRQLPRKFAHEIHKKHKNVSDRSAWNLIPEVWGTCFDIEHTPILLDRNNREARKTVTATVSISDEIREITFKAFQNAWDREKADSEDQKWAKEKKILIEKAKKGGKIL